MISNLQTPTHTSTDHESGALGVKIRRSVEGPFAPLLATLESLGNEFPTGDGRATRLGLAVEMLESVRHGVQALVDLIAPEEQHPSTCTLEELGRCALRAVPAALCSALHVAVEDSPSVCHVDGSRFSRCLSYMLLANLALGRESVFHISREGNSACFSLLTHPRPAAKPDEFMQLVAERELIRLGGCFEQHRRANGSLQLTVRLPLAPLNGVQV